MTTDAGPGRPRDPGIDARVLAITREHLARHGYAALSLAAIAREAGTTRQALYRRWPGKADLATAAIAGLSRADERPPTADPYTDLLRELEAYQDGVSRPDGVPMVGLMLSGGTDPDLVALYRERIVNPRRQAFRSILERAQAQGLIGPDADLDVVLTFLTGSWYAGSLTGAWPPDQWPARVARLAWRALGGTPPPA